MFQYSAFGLNIDSELELFQLASGTSSDVADIKILSGSVPDNGIDKDNPQHAHCQVHNGDLWLNIDNIVRFMVSNGNTITVDVQANVDQQTVKLYLLGSAMGAILQQRGNLVLHGNAIRFGNTAVIVLAQSGVGKSTLAAEFLRRGYQLLADDVCAIDQNGYAQSSYPYLKLWQSALDKLKLDQRELIPIREQNEKFYYPLNAAFYGDSLPVSAIYVLNKASVDNLKLIELKGINKLRTFQNNKYRPQYAAKMNIVHKHIIQFSEILIKIKVTRIIRPEKGFRLEELAQHIIDDFEKNER